jgi:hypothetical protein
MGGAGRIKVAIALWRGRRYRGVGRTSEFFLGGGKLNAHFQPSPDAGGVLLFAARFGRAYQGGVSYLHFCRSNACKPGE